MEVTSLRSHIVHCICLGKKKFQTLILTLKYPINIYFELTFISMYTYFHLNLVQYKLLGNLVQVTYQSNEIYCCICFEGNYTCVYPYVTFLRLPFMYLNNFITTLIKIHINFNSMKILIYRNNNFINIYFYLIQTNEI